MTHQMAGFGHSVYEHQHLLLL